MKNLYLFIFLMPALLFGMQEKECNKIRDKIKMSWETCHQLLIHLNQIDPSQDEFLQLLDQCIEHCRSCISGCEKILDDIASKSKREKKIDWRLRMKDICKDDKAFFCQRLNELSQARDNCIYQKATLLYQQSLSAADRAHQCIEVEKRQDNVEEVVAAYTEASHWFAQAAELAGQAFQLLSPTNREQDKAILSTAISSYVENSQFCLEEALKWPENAQDYFN